MTYFSQISPPKNPKTLNPTIWGKCFFPFVWTYTVYCHTHSTCEHALTDPDCGLAANGCHVFSSCAIADALVHWTVAQSRRSEFLLSGLKVKPSSNDLWFKNWMIIWSCHTAKLFRHHEWDTAGAGCQSWVSNFVRRRFKLVYVRVTKAWRRGFYHSAFIFSLAS